jgi:DNA replication protein DnaC
MEPISDWLKKTTSLAQRVMKTRPTGRDGGAIGLMTKSELEAVSRAAAAELAGERRAARQAAVDRAVGRAGVPARFRDHRIEDFVAEGEAQLRALTLAQEYAANFPAIRARGNCLLLLGAPGTGKTHLACAILAQVIQAGYTGLFLSVSEALRRIRATDSPGASQTEVEVFALLTTPDLLVLDEVGVAIGDEAKRRAILFDVLNARYNELRPTILIGNLTATELAGYLGERTMERLSESGSALVAFTWASYRRGG